MRSWRRGCSCHHQWRTRSAAAPWGNALLDTGSEDMPEVYGTGFNLAYGEAKCVSSAMLQKFRNMNYIRII
jgi:hypothetical protein